MMAIFNFKPLYVWQVSSGARVLVSQFESGKEQRRYKGRRPREWTLSFKDFPDVIRAIVAFYESRKGPFEAFSWTPPDEDLPVVVRFKSDTLDVTNYGLQYAGCELTLREVL